LLATEGHGAESFAHAPLFDHLADDLGGTLDIVAATGAHLTVDHSLRCMPAKRGGHRIEKLGAIDVVPIFGRQKARVAAAQPARNDGDLVHGTMMGQETSDKR